MTLYVSLCIFPKPVRRKAHTFCSGKGNIASLRMSSWTSPSFDGFLGALVSVGWSRVVKRMRGRLQIHSGPT